jgi:hypothetical protein
VGFENAEILREAIARLNGGERTVSLEDVDPDVEIDSRFSSLHGRPYRGTRGFGQWLAGIDEQFDLWRLELDDISDLGGDRLLARGSVHARGRASGLTLDWSMAMVVELRDGRLLRLIIKDSEEQAMHELESRP